MSTVCEELAAGMRANGFSEDAIHTIRHQLEAFASYGFPESHSASFALLVYASAYLKLYYAPEFYCAILNAQPMGFYSPATLIRDAIRHEVEVLPADLAKSSWDCILEPGTKTPENPNPVPALRIGLHYVQGMGKRAKEALEKAWQQGGAFTSIEDVCERSGLGWKALQVLARAGAFETLCKGRRKALWEVLALAQKGKELPLLKALQLNDDNYKKAPDIPEMTPLEQTAADYQTTGLSTGKHPMTFYRQWLKNNNIRSCGDLRVGTDGDRIVVAGGVIVRQRPGTAKGFVFLTLEDETGMANIIVKPKLFAAYRQVIVKNKFLAVRGILQIDQGVVNVVAEHVERLPTLNGDPNLPSRNFQ
jgi:error-prone DNA polymerase